MKNRAKKRCLRSCAAVMLAVILACVLASCGQAPLEGLPKTIRFADGVVVDQVNEGGELSFEMQDGEMLALSLLAAEAEVTEQGYPTRTLFATVQPASVLLEDQKRVTWAVRWLDNQTGDEAADVADYIMLTPDAEDSKICTVTCLQPFKGSRIEVECTTVVGGYKAQCEVSYTGAAQKVELLFDELMTRDDFAGEHLVLLSGSDVTAAYSAQNYFDDVNTDLEVTLEAIGGFDAYSRQIYASGSVVDFHYPVYLNVLKDETVEKTVFIVQAIFVYRDPSILNPDRQNSYLSNLNVTLCTVVVNNDGTIQITDLLSPFDIVYETTMLNDRQYQAVFSDQTNMAELLYFKLTLKDSVSGVSDSVNFRVYSEVGVDLNQGAVQF